MSKRYPGVKRLANGRIEIRATAYQDGKRKDRIETLPESTSLVDAAARRAAMMQEARAEIEAAVSPLKKLDRNATLSDYTRSWLAERVGGMKASARENYAHQLTETTQLVDTLLVEAGEDNTSLQNDLGVAVKVNASLALKTTLQIRHNTDVLVANLR